MQLPGQTGQEFVLQREFVPRRAANLSAFMFARTDGENYGKLVVYSVADSSAPSPAQAATAILSDQFISSQFTLLNQGGSKIDQGQVQLIPVGNAIVYVRSILVEGQGSQTFPRYRFVVAATGDQAVLGLDVNDAITGLLTGKPTEAERIVKNGGSLTTLNPNESGRRHEHDDHDVTDHAALPATAADERERAGAAQRGAGRVRPRECRARRQGSRGVPNAREEGPEVRRPGPGEDGRHAAGDDDDQSALIRPGAGIVRAPGDCYYGRSVNSPDVRTREMAVSGIDLGKYKLGWHDTESYAVTPKKGLNEQVVKRHLASEVRAGVDDEVPAQRAEAFRAQADARVVREEHADDRLRRHLLLLEADRRSPSTTGTCSRKR